MPLSDLYRWQKLLQVPLAELLSEPAGELSPPLQLRARLLRAMKTVRSIQEVARQVSVQRLASVLVAQILEIMPELKDTIAWPAVGHRRKQSELGQAFFRGLTWLLRGNGGAGAVTGQAGRQRHSASVRGLNLAPRSECPGRECVSSSPGDSLPVFTR